MANGDVLTLVAGHQAFAAPTGGGVQQVSLIGPFTVNFNDPEVDNDGVAVATLDVGVVILAAWAVTTVEWLANGAASGHYAAVTRGPGTGLPLAEYQGFGPLNSGPSFGAEGPATTVTHLIMSTTADARILTVGVFPASGTFTTGSLDAYALIATPA
jgi:hypothetical protein